MFSDFKRCAYVGSTLIEGNNIGNNALEVIRCESLGMRYLPASLIAHSHMHVVSNHLSYEEKKLLTWWEYADSGFTLIFVQTEIFNLNLVFP